MPHEIQVYDGTEAGKGEHYRQQIKGDFIALIKELQAVDPVKVTDLRQSIGDVIDFLDGKTPIEGTATVFFLLGQIAGEAYKQGEINLADRCHEMGNIFNIIDQETRRAATR